MTVVQLRPTPIELPGAEPVLSNMLFFLATGWLPWGHKFDTHEHAISLCGDRWILCCGNTLTLAEGDAAVYGGLFAPWRPDRFGRPTLMIGPRGEDWLSEHWPQAPYETGREE